MTQTFKYLVGIDGASDSDQICVVNAAGEVLGKKRVEHSGEGIRQLIDWLLPMAGGETATMAAARSAPVEVTTRAVNVEALKPWSMVKIM